jgi:hypothetical protein
MSWGGLKELLMMYDRPPSGSRMLQWVKLRGVAKMTSHRWREFSLSEGEKKTAPL